MLLAQHLHPGDYVRRVEFCEWILMKFQDEDFTKKNIWCDESKFTKNGMFNRHNSHFWSDENPHVTWDSKFQVSFSFNVFCAVKNNKIFALMIYDENLNGERYCNILRQVIVPAMHALPNNEANEAWFQQDGAPAHNSRGVGTLLDEIFNDRWVANKGPFL